MLVESIRSHTRIEGLTDKCVSPSVENSAWPSFTFRLGSMHIFGTCQVRLNPSFGDLSLHSK